MDGRGKQKGRSWTERALLALLLAVLGASLGVITAIAVPYLADEEETAQLQDTYLEPSEESVPYPVVDWDALLQDNPDVVGWVYVPGTNIDYPIVAAPAEDPEHYLKRDFSGNWSSAGTPYLDAECNGDFSSFNSIVFGHHLMNDSMFSAFADYSDESFFKSHRTVYLLTPKQVMTLRVVAVNVIDASLEEKRTSFADAGEYVAYWQSQLAQSEVVADDAPQAPLRNVCFVTCSYETPNARTLVYAVVDGE